jgi:polysaccharide export outer membrane protein
MLNGWELTGTKSAPHERLYPMKKSTFLSLLGLFFLLLAGCETPNLSGREGAAGHDGEGEVDTLAVENTLAHADTDAAVLRPGLMIRVGVLVSGEKEIDVPEKRIPDEGIITLPLIGQVDVNGLTLAELSGVLRKRYEDYLVRPEVVAQFVLTEGDSPWGHVTVLGHVAKPGKVAIPATRDMTVSGAIQQAGGLGPSAKDSAITLTRKLKSGEVNRSVVNLHALAVKGALEEDLAVRSGDVIYVPEKYL